MARIRRGRSDETVESQSQIANDNVEIADQIEMNSGDSEMDTNESAESVVENVNAESEVANENEGTESNSGSLAAGVTPVDSKEEEKPKTFDEQLGEYLATVNEHVTSGTYPMAASLLAIWSGIEPSFRLLEKLHSELSYTGPSDYEMSEKRAASDDDEIKAWNTEILELESKIAALKSKANRKIMGDSFVEPLTDKARQDKRNQFGTVREKVKSAIDGLSSILSINNDYMLEFTKLVTANIPDLRSTSRSGKAVAKTASSGTSTGAGRKPAFSELVIDKTSFEKLAQFKGILASGYGITVDAYGLRVLAEKHGATESNPVVEFPVGKKHNQSETVPIRIGINYDASWDEGKLADARASA